MALLEINKVRKEYLKGYTFSQQSILQITFPLLHHHYGFFMGWYKINDLMKNKKVFTPKEREDLF